MQGKLCYFLWGEKGYLEVFNIIVIAFQKLLRKRWKIPSLQIDKTKITDSLNQCVGKKFLHIVSLCLKQRKHNLLSSAEDEKSITKREYINKAHCSLEQSLLSKLSSCSGSFSPPYLHLKYHCPKLLFQGCIKHVRIYLFSEQWCHQSFSLTPKTYDQGSATEFNPLDSCLTWENILYTTHLITHFWTKIFSLSYPTKSPLIFFWDHGIHKITKNSAAGTLNKQGPQTKPVENY